VSGDVQGTSTRTVRVREGSIVRGNVQIKEAVAGSDVDALLVNFSRVRGDVQVEKSSGRMRVRDSRIGGNVQFVENRTGLYTVTNNEIDGDLQHFKSSGRVTFTRNDIDGDLQVIENTIGPYRIAYNHIDGNLQFFKNQGEGEIIGNDIDGDLQSKENSPRPTIRGNTVDD
jgi:hypothetical protein